jgi:hypothetical protein
MAQAYRSIAQPRRGVENRGMADSFRFDAGTNSSAAAASVTAKCTANKE